MPNKQFFSLLLILLVVLCLVRIPGLFNRGLENDEAITMLVVAGQSSPAFPRNITTIPAAYEEVFSQVPTARELSEQLKVKDVHPPLYFNALSYWIQIFGQHYVPQRVFSIFSFALATLFFALILRTSGLGVWTLPLTAFYGLTAATVFYSYDIRQYMFSQALVNLAVYLLLLAKNSEKQKQWGLVFASGAVWGLGFYSSYLVVFTAMAAGLYLLSFPAQNLKAHVQRVLFFTVPFLIATAAVFPFYMAQRNSRPDQDHGYFGVLRDLASYAILLRDGLFITWWSFLAIPLGVVTAALVAYSLFYFFRKANSAQNREVFFALVLMLLPILGLMILNALTNKHIYRYQSTYLSSTGLIWLMAFGIYALRERTKTWAIAILGFFMVVQTASLNWGVDQAPVDFRAGPYRQMAQELLKTSPGKTLFLVDRGQSRDLPAAILIYLFENLPASEVENKHIAYWYSNNKPLPSTDWKAYDKVVFISDSWSAEDISKKISITAIQNGFQLLAKDDHPSKDLMNLFFQSFGKKTNQQN